MRPLLPAVGLAAVLALAPLAAPAQQTDNVVFELSLRGLRAGELIINGQQSGASYAASGTLRSTGILGAIRKMRYDAAVRGTLRNGRYVPQRYEERADTGKRQSESVMDYRAGVPQVEVYNPPRERRPTDLDPATQGGTVDPLTALYAALRDVPEAQACKLRVFTFDGRRRAQVTLNGPTAAEDKITCTGEYRRLAGFSEKDMQEKTRFPFRLTYERAGNGMMRVTGVTMDTLYGKGELKRR